MGYDLADVNGKSRIDWEYDTTDFEFVNRKDMRHDDGHIYNVHGFFFHNKSKFGESGVVILDKAYVDLPAHMNDGIKNLLTIPKFIEDVKADKIGLKVYRYDTETRKNCVGFEIVKK